MTSPNETKANNKEWKRNDVATLDSIGKKSEARSKSSMKDVDKMTRAEIDETFEEIQQFIKQTRRKLENDEEVSSKDLDLFHKLGRGTQRGGMKKGSGTSLGASNQGVSNVDKMTDVQVHQAFMEVEEFMKQTRRKLENEWEVTSEDVELFERLEKAEHPFLMELDRYHMEEFQRNMRGMGGRGALRALRSAPLGGGSSEKAIYLRWKRQAIKIWTGEPVYSDRDLVEVRLFMA